MFKNKLISNAKKIDLFLKNYLKSQKRSLLIDPMNYGVLSGGKKIRSSIIFAAGKLYNLKSIYSLWRIFEQKKPLIVAFLLIG